MTMKKVLNRFFAYVLSAVWLAGLTVAAAGEPGAEVLAGGCGLSLKEPVAGYTITNAREENGFNVVFEVQRGPSNSEDTVTDLRIRRVGSAAGAGGSALLFRKAEDGWRPLAVNEEAGYHIYTISDTGTYAVKYDNVYKGQETADAAEIKFLKVVQRVFTPDEASVKANRCIFSYENPSYVAVTIKIFNVMGCLVRNNLASNGSYGTTYEQYWDGKDGTGTSVKAGPYIYQIESGKTVITGTVVVAK